MWVQEGGEDSGQQRPHHHLTPGKRHQGRLVQVYVVRQERINKISPPLGAGKFYLCALEYGHSPYGRTL